MADTHDVKNKIIDETILNIEKAFGKGFIMRLGDGVINKVECIPTGALSLDRALGIGGIPRGRITEIYGPSRVVKPQIRSPCNCRSTKNGWNSSFYRCRTCS